MDGVDGAGVSAESPQRRALHVPRAHLPQIHRPQSVDPLAWTRVLEQRYIRIRLVGWLLIGAWQVLSLASEFWRIDLESRTMRITGKALGLAGLLLVAWGFERIVHLNEARRRITEAKVATKTDGQRP